VASQRDASVALGIQGNSATQTANLTEWKNSAGTVLDVVDKSGNVGIGVTAPTAALHLEAGTSTASTAPLKFTSGANLSTPENGAVEYDGTNYFATSGGTRYTLAKTLTNTATLDFPNTTKQNAVDLTITVTGAVLGDVVEVGVPFASVVTAGSFNAYVSSADTVTVRFTNNGTANANPASGTFRVSVIRY
jgi:hypothetical protein